MHHMLHTQIYIFRIMNIYAEGTRVVVTLSLSITSILSHIDCMFRPCSDTFEVFDGPQGGRVFFFVDGPVIRSQSTLGQTGLITVVFTTNNADVGLGMFTSVEVS